jgi:hypothetical protein
MWLGLRAPSGGIFLAALSPDLDLLQGGQGGRPAMKLSSFGD